MPDARRDVIVVGAGIVGCACAAEIARSGRSVILAEAVDVASDTSCRAMGHVGVYDDNSAQIVLTRYARRLWEEIAPELPPEVEFVRRGALWVAPTEEEMAEVEAKERVYRDARVEARVVDTRTLHEMEPNLNPDLPGALFVPGDIVVDATESTRFLARRAQSFGAEIRVGTRVRTVAPDGVVLEDGSEWRAETVVVAAGWQVAKLLPQVPVRPRKGHIALTEPRPGFVRHQVSEVGYVRGADAANPEVITFSFQPRTSGRYLIGATRQYVGESAEVEPRIIEALLTRARRFLPDVDRLKIERTWTGFRPAGPDAVPLIGPLPGQPGTILAAAHEGIGITTALATGHLVADLVAGSPTEIPVEPYLPSRLSPPRAV
jgi:glycine/D-amino acid oxidase-like deaminating enzyme